MSADTASGVVTPARTIPSPPQIADWRRALIAPTARMDDIKKRLRAVTERQAVLAMGKQGREIALARMAEEVNLLKALIDFYIRVSDEVAAEASECDRIDLLASGESVNGR